MEFISGILGPILTGGVTGIIGTGLSGVLALLKKGQNHKYELELRKIDLQEIRLEGAMADKRHALMLEATTVQSQSQALQESYKNARSFLTSGKRLTPAQTWVMVFIDLVRMMMRPVITLFMVIWLYRIYGNTEFPDIYEQVASSVIYLTTTVVMWWFGSRQIDRHMNPNK